MYRIRKENKIYVNRSLNFGDITWIGFDLDHTLACYNKETFESMSFDLAVKKLIEKGYPKEIQNLEYSPNNIIRGLLLDKAKGNIIKIDEHRYVKTAYHGRQLLSKKDRYKLYNSKRLRFVDTESVDTFFHLSVALLYMFIVDYYAKKNNKLSNKRYNKIYLDITEAVDLSHNDNSIKSRVLGSPEEFILKDKNLLSTLLTLKMSGKSLFLLTNSPWHYACKVMDYIFAEEFNDEFHWSELWDCIICSANKPDFFVSDKKFGAHKSKSINYLTSGSAAEFEKLINVYSGDILYVGDHLYGDIVRSKEAVNWRTMMLLPEIEDEIVLLKKFKNINKNILDLIEKKDLIESKIEQIIKSGIGKIEIKKSINFKKYYMNYRGRVGKLEVELLNLSSEIKKLVKEKENKINPIWGGVMKTGLEHSRFARQVVSHACLYTSKVSNLGCYSPYKSFLSYNNILPHEY